MMNPVVHFEMPYRDRDRAARFYAEAFGWKMEKLGPEMGNYVVAETAETENGRPVTPGAINGGFFPRNADMPAQVPSVVVSVEDSDTRSTRASSSGGNGSSAPPMPMDRSNGVVRLLADASTWRSAPSNTASVKVPPVSMPRLMVMPGRSRKTARPYWPASHNQRTR